MSVLEEIAAERRRQVEVEGWSVAHDDAHDFGDLAAAGGCYAINADPEGWREGDGPVGVYWPWEPEWWKPSTPRRDMVKAAALLVAAVERHDRQVAAMVKPEVDALKPLPPAYAWLDQRPGLSRMLVIARAMYGVTETPGPASTAQIMAWAAEVGLAKTYPNDGTAWCGLFAAVVAKRAGWDVVSGPLWARNWANFGRAVEIKDAALGDVLVFSRDGGGHVGFYVGEDAGYFHVLGGNQGDAVSFTRIAKSRCIAVRRPKWKTAEPAGVVKMHLKASGAVSENEA